jgi:hypothetical protein
MNEAQWLASGSPQEMLRFLRDNDKLSERKWRLFAAACCRRIDRLLTFDRSRDVIGFAERFADGLAGAEELTTVYERAERALKDWPGILRYDVRGAAAAAFATACPNLSGAFRARHFAALAAGGGPGEALAQVALLSDLFGNPFRSPPTINPAWLSWNDCTVRRLAEAIYEQRELPSGHLDNARLGVLADALEEAGCRDPDILAHCRQEGAVHVRGCWLIDLLLNRV